MIKALVSLISRLLGSLGPFLASVFTDSNIKILRELIPLAEQFMTAREQYDVTLPGAEKANLVRAQMREALAQLGREASNHLINLAIEYVYSRWLKEGVVK